MMALQAQGQVPPGVHRVEQAVRAGAVMTELERRGIPHSVRWE
jgi:hypothetical protein